jgi:vitamin B12/bleomycin/antimicrobial peptide transport system ATP-binding/permease protein
MALQATNRPPAGRWHGHIWDWLCFLGEFVRLAGPFWASETRWRANLLTVALVLLTFAQVALAVVLNLWLEKLFNALGARALDRFFLLISVFVLIVAGNAAVVTMHLWVKRRLQVRWREWLTARLLGEWMASGKHYLVRQYPGEHDNPDGRIAEDIRIGTEYAVDLAHSLFYCALLLVSFTKILWTLSGPPELTIGGVTLYIPGHMVWVAVVYAAVGSALAVVLGYPLIQTANLRQTAEADFRYGLAHARESALSIALLHGELDERRRFLTLFRRAFLAWNRQTTALSHIFLFSASWSVISQVFPIFVAAPRYIAGTITLGVLMQTAQAFQQMAAALSWPIDNLAKAAEWRASVQRVQGLHRAIEDIPANLRRSGRPTIALEQGDEPVLAIADCTIEDPDGHTAIAPFSLRIHAGEHVLISGDATPAEKLLKALAGLWPWGRGRIAMPAGGTLFFMPDRPHIPAGSLRDAVEYPSPNTFDDAAIRRALQCVELDQLIGRLDEQATWEQTLSPGDLQRIGFARLLLQRPAWIFIQEGSDALDAEEKVRLLRRVYDALPGAAFVTVGRPAVVDDLYQRTFTLVQVDHIATLQEVTRDRAATPPAV